MKPIPAEATLLLLDKNVVEQLLTPDEVTLAVREAFLLHAQREGRVFPVVREKLSTGVFGIKTGDVPSQGLLGLKAAGFWPRNRELGSEPHQATILLFDPATGRPLCVIDGNAITTERTGARVVWGWHLLPGQTAAGSPCSALACRRARNCALRCVRCLVSPWCAM